LDDGHDTPALAEGDLVAGRYRIVRLLGQGGMGTVYEAEHGWTKRRVALKLLRAELSTNERVVSRFLREARACARLSHPNLVDVLDMGQDEHDGALFLAQELVEGDTLRERLRARGRLPVAEAIALTVAIARGLEAAHRAGIVHRDVKPENVMVSEAPDGSTAPKLIDFGVARELEPSNPSQTRTSLGVPIGTPLYMSPEQARAGGAIDHRSDIFSLGTVLYECLAGRTPYSGETVTMLLAHILTQPPPPLGEVAPWVSPALCSVVMTALAREPSARFESAEAFARALEALSPESLERPIAPPAAPAHGSLLEPASVPSTLADEPPRRATVTAPSSAPRARARASGPAALVTIAIVTVAGFVTARATVLAPARANTGSPDQPAPRPATTPLSAPRVESTPNTITQRVLTPPTVAVVATSSPRVTSTASERGTTARRTRTSPRAGERDGGLATSVGSATANARALEPAVPGASERGTWLRPVVPQ
jgi:serine/threonine protein kinase